MEAADSRQSAAKFARDVHEPATELERLQLGVELMVEVVDGCDHAGITLVSAGGLSSPAATSPLVLTGDQMQSELAEGPCIDSVRQQVTVVSGDLANEPRWPRWGPAVVQRLGIRSMISLLLYTHSESLGAVNLYSTRVDGFPKDAVPMAECLAAHLAVALSAGREIDHRGAAMLSRTVIGQAEGILMERLRITAQQAFEILRDTSKNTNRKLVSVAEELVRTGLLAGVAERAGKVPAGE